MEIVKMWMERMRVKFPEFRYLGYDETGTGEAERCRRMESGRKVTSSRRLMI